KGCYLGQEVIARVSSRGHVNRKLFGLRLLGYGAGQGDALPQRGAALSHESRPNAGTLGTVVRSPRLGPIALGYVHRSLWEPGTRLKIEGGDAPPGAVAVVTPLPFAAPAPSETPLAPLGGEA